MGIFARSIAVLFLLVMFLSGPACSVFAERPREMDLGTPDRLWMDAENSRELFISEGHLQGLDVNESARLRALATRVRIKKQPELFKQHFGGQVPECRIHERHDPRGSSTEAESLEELVRGSLSSFVGSIDTVTVGWDAWRNEVAQLVTLEVEEVVVPNSGPMGVVEGERVAILISGGRIQLDGVTICDSFDEGFLQPAVGERVLVAGARWEADPRFFETSYLFPVDGDEIQVQPYSDLCKSEQGTTLSVLRMHAVRAQGAERLRGGTR